MLPSLAFLTLSLVKLAYCDCESYGVDFQSGGTYFQNSLSTDPFTALQEFEGCQNDIAHNVFVTPDGEQSECSLTPMQPDDVPQLINCTQWPKNQLYSGDWSLIIVSNNGDAEPIAYQRDFSLIVGPQQTVTLPIPTITSGQTTVTPAPVSVSVTVGLIQFTVYTTMTMTQTTTLIASATCSQSPTSSSKDPLATIIPSILGGLNSVASSVINGGRKRSEPTSLPGFAKFKRAMIEGHPVDGTVKAEFIRARREGLQKLAKRAPDSMTITATPSPVYVKSTVTALGSTMTRTVQVLAYITTLSRSTTVISTTTVKTAPSGAAASCASAGGQLV